jgi:hypothetical protein
LVSLRDSSLTLPDGSVVRTLNRGMVTWTPLEGSDEPPQRVAIRRLLAVERISDGLSPKGDDTAAILVLPGDVRRLEAAAAVYRGTFDLDFSHVEIAGSIPLATGASFDGGVYQLTVRNPNAAGQHLISFNGVETRATSMFDRSARASYTLYAVNRARSEAIEGAAAPQGQMGDFAGFGVHVTLLPGEGFSRRGVALAFWLRHDSAVSIDADWLRNAQLVVVRTVPGGHLTRSIEVPSSQPGSRD